MKKKLIGLLMAVTLCAVMATGCGDKAATGSADVADETEETTDAADESDDADADVDAADETDDTDAAGTGVTAGAVEVTWAEGDMVDASEIMAYFPQDNVRMYGEVADPASGAVFTMEICKAGDLALMALGAKNGDNHATMTVLSEGNTSYIVNDISMTADGETMEETGVYKIESEDSGMSSTGSADVLFENNDDASCKCLSVTDDESVFEYKATDDDGEEQVMQITLDHAQAKIVAVTMETGLEEGSTVTLDLSDTTEDEIRAKVDTENAEEGSGIEMFTGIFSIMAILDPEAFAE